MLCCAFPRACCLLSWSAARDAACAAAAALGACGLQSWTAMHGSNLLGVASRCRRCLWRAAPRGQAHQGAGHVSCGGWLPRAKRLPPSWLPLPPRLLLQAALTCGAALPPLMVLQVLLHLRLHRQGGGYGAGRDGAGGHLLRLLRLRLPHVAPGEAAGVEVVLRMMWCAGGTGRQFCGRVLRRPGCRLYAALLIRTPPTWACRPNMRPCWLRRWRSTAPTSGSSTPVRL